MQCRTRTRVRHCMDRRQVAADKTVGFDGVRMGMTGLQWFMVGSDDAPPVAAVACQ